jgi:hypothetical protein
MQQRPKHFKSSRLFDNIEKGIYNYARSHSIPATRTYYIDMTIRQWK